MTVPRFDRLETSRLALRRLEARDLAALVAYRADPMVARYQTWEGYDEARGQALIEEMRGREPGQAGWFQFALELKETLELVGDCALKVEEHDPRLAELGFTLAPAHQGRGLATEAVGALLGYAFATLGLHRVVAITDERNAPSVAVLERAGMRREGHLLENVRFKGGWASEFLYAILEREWRERRT